MNGRVQVICATDCRTVVGTLEVVDGVFRWTPKRPKVPRRHEPRWKYTGDGYGGDWSPDDIAASDLDDVDEYVYVACATHGPSVVTRAELDDWSRAAVTERRTLRRYLAAHGFPWS